MPVQKGLDNWVDMTVISVYFIGVLAVGLWSVCRVPGRRSIKGYFLAGRDMCWLPVGASLYASNIGSEHFIGLAGTGAASGIAVVIYEWSSLPLLIALGWLFLPVYISSGVFTLPEYLESRTGGQRLRVYLSCLSLLLYIATKIVVCIYAGALYIQLALGWNMYLAITLLLSTTCLYTVLGGLAAVIYTDTVQTIVMTIGAIILTVISFQTIGGYSNLESQYMSSVPNLTSSSSSFNATCSSSPRADSFHLLRDPMSEDNPWPGLIMQATLGCLWYWCCDQVIVQRALAAKNLSHAKAGSLFAGYLKLMPLFFMVFPGMISRILYPDEVGCTDPAICEAVCGNPKGCSNIAYPMLVMQLMPTGLRGLLLAVMMSAITSSLTSIFNSASTLFTMDIWTKIRPQAQDRELLIVGRLCIVVLCVISVLWIPLVQSSAGGQLFIYIQAVQGYLGTPIGALFIMAVFWSRFNEQGAFWGILTGHSCGIVRMILDFIYPPPGCGEIDSRPLVVSQLHYTYFSQLNLLLTIVVIIIVSLLTRKEGDEMRGVTWWTCKASVTTSSYKGDKAEHNANTNDDKCQPGQEDIMLHNVSESSSRKEIEEASSVDGVNATYSVRACFDVVCGMPPSTRCSQHEQEESREDRLKLLVETPGWKTLVNINAVMSLCVMAFLIGHFA